MIGDAKVPLDTQDFSSDTTETAWQLTSSSIHTETRRIQILGSYINARMSFDFEELGCVC